MSTQARQVLAALSKTPASPATPESLASQLDLPSQAVNEAAGELVGHGVVEWADSRLRLADGAARPSRDGAKILARLPVDGTGISTTRLRGRVDLGDGAFYGALQDLEEAGLITTGHLTRTGTGMTVARARPPKATQTPGSHSLVSSERDLYAPFVAWLRSTFAAAGPAATMTAAKTTTAALIPPRVFQHALDTSTRGWAPATGQWSRPDVTAVEVWSADLLPRSTLTVSSYEIKRSVDAKRLESVYEAKAHGRWAHRSSLVIELDPESDGEQLPIADAVLVDLNRFGLGLYTMRHRADGGYHVEEEIPPGPQHPEDRYVNDLLTYYFGDDHKARARYRSAIGRQ